jgi:hypothetical protein
MKAVKTFSFALAAVSALTVLASANAAVIVGATGTDNLGVHAFSPGAETGFGFIQGSNVSFNHQWLFSISAPADGSGSAVANSNFLSGIQTVGITNGTVSLYRDFGTAGFDAGDSLVGSTFAFSSLLPGSEIYPSLVSGNYFYKVTGTTLGTSSGNYVLNSTMEAAVPAPAGLALLAIGGIAFAVTRKSAKNSDAALKA